MKNWFTSLSGAITLSTIALLLFLGRGFMDWRYEYPLQDPAGAWDIPGALIYMALAGGWIVRAVGAHNPDPAWLPPTGKGDLLPIGRPDWVGAVGEAPRSTARTTGVDQVEIAAEGSLEDQLAGGPAAMPMGCDGKNTKEAGPCDVNEVFPGKLKERKKERK